MNGRIFFLFFCLFALLPACEDDKRPTATGDSSGFVPAGYELVWNDEFDTGTMPDEANWGYQTGGHGWTAKELQNYQQADPDNVGIEDGHLRITALPERVGLNRFTSTRLVSKKKADFTSGYFEVRAKFPAGEGLRSAFWMVGDTVSKMGWPDAGEIDLVEHYGSFPTVVNAAVQTKVNFWMKKNQQGGSTIVKGAEEDFHVYSCTWTEDKLEFAVDGQPYWEYLPVPGKGKASFPFRWPFYLVATLSVGGERGPIGEVKPAVFPAHFLIDYVRVYQLR
ncbi:MAG: glycoside hydrolase family 16 protein [Bacteroidota bacterium]